MTMASTSFGTFICNRLNESISGGLLTLYDMKTYTEMNGEGRKEQVGASNSERVANTCIRRDGWKGELSLPLTAVI